MGSWAVAQRPNGAAAKFGPESHPGNKIIAQQPKEFPVGEVGNLLCRCHRNQTTVTPESSNSNNCRAGFEVCHIFSFYVPQAHAKRAVHGTMRLFCWSEMFFESWTTGVFLKRNSRRGF
jgi:hypothetical protein